MKYIYEPFLSPFLVSPLTKGGTEGGIFTKQAHPSAFVIQVAFLTLSHFGYVQYTTIPIQHLLTYP